MMLEGRIIDFLPLKCKMFEFATSINLGAELPLL